jgi:hypothetical protein
MIKLEYKRPPLQGPCPVLCGFLVSILATYAEGACMLAYKSCWLKLMSASSTFMASDLRLCCLLNHLIWRFEVSLHVHNDCLC